MKKILIVILCCSMLLGCMAAIPVEKIPSNEKQTELNIKYSKEDRSFTITFLGDIMMHNTQISAGYNTSKNAYDYSLFFRHITPLLKASDLVIGNLETTFAGEKAAYSGFPYFNSPEILAKNLKDAGLDVLTTANNHCMDKGFDGLSNTLHVLDNEGLLHTGTSRSKKEMNTILITEVKGIKVAILAYTMSTNGIMPARKNSYAVNFLYPETIKEDIKKAKLAGSQLVLVYLHFGQEYQTLPNIQQKQIAYSLYQAGADIIIGSHPHVIQHAELFKNTDNKQHFVIYSMGNFISDQRGFERKSGIILNLSFKIDENSKPTFTQGEYVPIWTHKYKNKYGNHFEVIPIESALISAHYGNVSSYTNSELNDIKQAWELINNKFAQNRQFLRLKRLNLPLEGIKFWYGLTSVNEPNM